MIKDQFAYETLRFGLEGFAQCEALRNMELGRLLRETDVPYVDLLGRNGLSKYIPACLGLIAPSTGVVLEMPWKEVLQISNRNTRCLYADKQPPE